MKRLIFSAISALIIACSMPPARCEAQNIDEAYWAYYDFVSDEASDFYFGEFNKYQLIYVNGDDIPELLAAHSPKDTFDNNGTWQYALYTFKNGKVKNLAGFSSGVASAGGYRGNTYYLPNENRIYETYISSGTGEGEDNIYKMAKVKLKRLHKGTYSLATESGTWKGSALSLDEYRAQIGKVFDLEGAESFEDIKFVSKKKMKKILSEGI